MEKIKSHPKIIRWFFFWTGIIATIAYRAIIFLNFYDPLWVQVAWYIGTIGFIIYFWHRYDIQKKRSEFVKDYGLMDLVKKNVYGSKKQQEALSYIVRTNLTSKAKWNSLFIFWLSTLVLVASIIIDLKSFLWT